MSHDSGFAPCLAQLLGIRSQVSLSISNPPPGFLEALGTLPASVAVMDCGALGIDVQVLFTSKKVEAVERLSIMVRRMSERGSIWVCIPEGAHNGQVPSEEFIRLAAIELGLRDIRALRLSLDWCGLLLKRRLSSPRIELPQTLPG